MSETDALARATVLTPVRQETVQFYGDSILAVQMADGTIYVPMRPLVESIGLTWPSQSRRINEEPPLRKNTATVRIETAGGPQDMLALPLKVLPGWLFGMKPARLTKPGLQAKVERYQEDCYTILWNAFKGEIQPALPPPAGLSGAEQALATLEALTELARQQVENERKLNVMADYMRGHVRQTNQALRDHAARLSALELHVGPAAVVDENQAARISLLVKDIATALTRRDGANHYGAVYEQLYREFEVTSYKQIPRVQYEDALRWLEARWTEVKENP